MSIIRKILLNFLLISFCLTTFSHSQELKKLGTYKDWQAISVFNESGKVCFAQSKPCLLYTSPSPRDS